MPDETTEQVIEPTVAETEEAKTEQPTLEEWQTKMDELIKSNETQKNEIAGLNKANSTQKTAYDELLKQHETEAETKTREANELKELQEKERTSFYNEKSTFEQERTKWEVEKKAFDMGFTAEDIEQLKFSSVEHVESTRAYLDAKIQSSKDEQTKEIETALSGNREQVNIKPLEVASYPKAIDRAFK
ncbi:MAG: hypothetical protein GY775_15860 [Candidatus Scalindua sp.]|nr:hypothetical protein [Candidatus Scalindua sp.]